MVRHYYVTDDLNDLEHVEYELERKGIIKPQVHVLSEDDEGLEEHHLHAVDPFLKQDIVHSTEVFSIIGFIVAIISLILAGLMGWTNSAAGWIPFIFLAVIIFCFFTWEGGFIGIQTTNIHFVRFQELLHQGKHILFIDVTPSQERQVEFVVKCHPQLHPAGTGSATPYWVIVIQDKFKRFMKLMP